MTIPKPLAGLGVAVALVFTPVVGVFNGNAQALPVPAETHSATPGTTADSAQASSRAADYLAAQMPEGQLNGMTGTPDPGNTVDAALALLATGGHTDTVDKATEWLRGQARDYTKDGTDAGRLGKLAIYADAAGIDPTDFGGLNLIEGMQHAASPTENPFSSALLVLGLARTETEVPDRVVGDLLATRDPGGSGAFGFGAATPIDQDSTALAAQALSLLTENAEARAAAVDAADFLAKDFEANGKWTTYSPANTAGLAIPVLAAGGHDSQSVVTWLLGQQQADGGFPASLDGSASDAFATAQALLGLAGSSVAAAPAKVEAASPTPNSASASPAATASASANAPGTAASDGNNTIVIGLVVLTVLAVGIVLFSRYRTK